MAPRSFTIPDPPPPPTSLANLITSNEAPSDGESSLASAYIDELEPHIALLDEALAFLSRRHAALLASLNAHKSIVSPIRRLPPELLGEIFSFSVHATYSLRGVSGPPCRRAPWLLAHVCSRWAAVALASPVLWTMVSLDLDRLKAAEDGAVSMTNVWLERSKDLPMTLRIFHYKDELDFPFVVDTLIAQS
ncbi:hypothetical protein DFH09DRAFT_477879 [Mycena vulgaris]|nr:hypothetical protein DFH09DRAFT_477879 [Mycena vulgaris]